MAKNLATPGDSLMPIELADNREEGLPVRPDRQHPRPHEERRLIALLEACRAQQLEADRQGLDGRPRRRES
jgi:hypothetical protein